MRTLLGTLALATIVASNCGCYISRQCCDPCGGVSSHCTEFGFSHIFGGCNNGCQNGYCECATYAPCAGTCDVAYGPGCEMPYAGDTYGWEEGYAPQYEYESGPEPTFAPQESQRAPSAPTPMPVPAGNDAASTGWQSRNPARQVRQVRHVQYPNR